ncbi:MAG: putative phospho-glucose isomerase, partial [Modestobacter sp.]|nr:putative phospho-glucose isomerase [Modestobacter sp.]
MTSAELAEEVFDDPELLRARDPRNLLPAVAGAGAQVRETTRLTQEAGLERVTAGGRPRGLVFVARREGAVAASVLRALLGPTSLVTVDVVPGPALPVWMGATDIAVVATRTGAGRYAVTPAYEAARRGVAVVGIGADDAPLHAACAAARAPYVALPASRVRHATLWSMLTPMLLLADRLGLLADGVADPEAVAAALDEVAAECGPARESFVNPAKTLALELLDALPVIAAEGPLAGAAAERVADQLAALAGLPVATFRLPDQRVAACAVLG